ncbi:MAG TPA: NADH-quinone oxidoreductase subunit J [Tepidisphaeraceae bacterium]|jgi:NADH-quinone oxidoreductase subunit J
MTESHFVPAALNFLAQAASPLPSESVIAPPFTPALIIGLCVAAGLATWLALPSKREVSIRRIGAVILGAVGLVVAALMVRWTVDQGGMSVYFWLFSVVALFASVRVITHTKPVYSALYFVLTVFATGGLFVLLWAEFIAAALVLIYAGAILITYVFVIMLASEAVTGGGADSVQLVSDHDAHSRDPFWAAMTGFAVTGLLIYLIFDKSAALDRNRPALAFAGSGTPVAAMAASPVGTHDATPAANKPAELQPDLGSAQALGQELIDNQALNVQLAGILLTVAMVGAITLARRRVIVAAPEGGHEIVSTPATPVDDNPKSIPIYGTDNPRHKAYPEN